MFGIPFYYHSQIFRTQECCIEYFPQSGGGAKLWMIVVLAAYVVCLALS